MGCNCGDFLTSEVKKYIIKELLPNTIKEWKEMPTYLSFIHNKQYGDEIMIVGTESLKERRFVKVGWGVAVKLPGEDWKYVNTITNEKYMGIDTFDRNQFYHTISRFTNPYNM